jgi:hypothetical protein
MTPMYAPSQSVAFSRSLRSAAKARVSDASTFFDVTDQHPQLAGRGGLAVTLARLTTQLGHVDPELIELSLRPAQTVTTTIPRVRT